MSNKLSKNYSQKRLGPAKKIATDAINATPKRVIQKRKAEATTDLTDNKIFNKMLESSITKRFRDFVTNRRKIKGNTKKIHMCPNKKKTKKKKQIIDELILIWNMEYQKYKI